MQISASDLHRTVVRDIDIYYCDHDNVTDWSTRVRVACDQLAKSIVKKFNNEGTSELADKVALDKFVGCNDACREYTLARLDVIPSEIVGEVKKFLSDCFLWGPDLRLTFAEICAGIDVGPGASVGVKGQDFYTKIATSDHTSTNHVLFEYYERAIGKSGLWADTEAFRRTFRANTIVDGSRLSFVAKTTEVSRTICTEPLLNMLFQKGIGRVLEQILIEKLGVNLSTQPEVNAELARVGSITGQFATIDLSSASDTISRTVIHEFFPPHVVRWLELTRSPYTTLPGGEKLELQMISSMGNAFTFPLQTLLFGAIVVAVYRYLGIKLLRTKYNGKGYDLGSFGVFGDDIIVRSESFELVCQTLEAFGFTVNHDKSFNEGHFRESCGHDYYDGYNVRGVYIRQLLTDSDVYSAINRLVRWSARHGVPLFYTVGLLTRCLENREIFPIPYEDADDAGLKVPLDIAFKLGACWSKKKQAWRYNRLQPKLKRVIPNFEDADWRPRNGLLPTWINNPSGAVLAAVAGRLRGGSIAIRSDSKRVKLAPAYSSRWDYMPRDPAERRGFGDDWKVITSLYFG